MIIHIGENISLLEEEIVIIIDKKIVSNSKQTKEFIDKLIQSGSLVTQLDESVKTFIVTSEKNKRKKEKSNNHNNYKLYTSSISSSSLLKRKNSNGQI